METPLLDNGPMLEQRGDKFCCLLCQRQFDSDVKLRKHLTKSSLHADNLAAAEAAGRVAAQQQGEPPAAKRPAPDAAAPPSKRERSEAQDRGSNDSGGASSSQPPASPPPAPPQASSSSGLSAIEQMELFEKRLKVDAKRQPEKEKHDPEKPAIVDSNCARTMNGNMDWKCSDCGMLNFARVVVCGKCSRHIDHTTEYVSNRLKEIKHERFARYFANDDGMAGRVYQPQQQEQRSDGSHPTRADRASFSQR